MNNEPLAISTKFSLLVLHVLNESETKLFIQIIDILFRDVESGHSCSNLINLAADLDEYPEIILSVLRKSKLIAEYNSSSEVLQPLPFSLWQANNQCLVYITRYLAYEMKIVKKIERFTSNLESKNINHNIREILSILSDKNGLPNKDQLMAIENSYRNKFSIITGGPGTGKTTTVVLLLWTLYQQYGNDINVKICAPTGKAAIRVRDSIASNIARLDHQANDLIDTSCFSKLMSDANNFSTIHKLLGYIPNNIYFRHNRDNPLACDILIIDESSMVGLPLFSKLLDAVDDNKIKHIVFLGDKNQLSSVEEGFVFSSLVDLKLVKQNDNPIDLFSQITDVSIAQELRETKRSNQEISHLARLILNNQTDLAIEYLHHSTSLQSYKPLFGVFIAQVMHEDSLLLRFINHMRQINYEHINHKLIFNEFTRQSTLCLTNSGLLGSDNVNQHIERQIKLKFAISSEWYSGRPVIILQNDYTLELFNGDIGICVVDGDEIRIIFESGKQLIPELLPRFSLAYAITIHKSQGSEYEQVNVIIPDVHNDLHLQQLLSRSLFYTAITRAKDSVNIFASDSSIIHAISNNNVRVSGLSLMMGF